MVRKIIRIDEEKCIGCGICANACHEGAIDIIDGKAKLVRENFCDGFGDCLPGCPTGAITFEEREAPEYDETAVKEAGYEQLESNAAKDNILSIGFLRNAGFQEYGMIPHKKKNKDGSYVDELRFVKWL